MTLFTTENTNNLPDINNIFLDEDNEKLSDVLITPELVHSKLSKLKMNKSPGIDFVGVEFYLYPTVGTVLIHSVKPELTE